MHVLLYHYMVTIFFALYPSTPHSPLAHPLISNSFLQARNLQAFGELPTNARINQTAVDMAMDGAEGAEEDMGFDFEDVSSGNVVCIYLVCVVY